MISRAQRPYPQFSFPVFSIPVKSRTLTTWKSAFPGEWRANEVIATCATFCHVFVSILLHRIQVPLTFTFFLYIFHQHIFHRTTDLISQPDTILDSAFYVELYYKMLDENHRRNRNKYFGINISVFQLEYKKSDWLMTSLPIIICIASALSYVTVNIMIYSRII